MNWRTKFIAVISSTLNKDGDGAYGANLLDDNSFEITWYGDRILLSEVYIPEDLSSHWKAYAKKAVMKVVENNFEDAFIKLNDAPIR